MQGMLIALLTKTLQVPSMSVEKYVQEESRKFLIMKKILWRYLKVKIKFKVKHMFILLFRCYAYFYLVKGVKKQKNNKKSNVKFWNPL